MDYDPSMEARIAKVEVGIEYLQRDVKEIKEDLRALRADFRVLFAAILTLAIGMAGTMARVFGWL